MRSKIKNKFALYAIIVFFVCFASSSVLFYFACSRYIEKNVSSVKLSQIRTICEELDFLVKNLNYDIDTLQSDVNVQEVLNNYDKLSDEEKNSIISKVNGAINDFGLKREKEILYTRVISKNYESISLGTYYDYDRLDSYSYRDLERLLDNRESMWLDNQDYSGKSNGSGQTSPIAYIRKIKDSKSKEDIGIIRISFKTDFFDNVLQGTSENFILVKDNGGVVYRYGTFDGIRDYGIRDTLQNQGYFVKNISKTKYLVTYSYSSYNNWKIYSYTNFDSYFIEMQRIRNYIFLIGFLSLSSIILFSFIVSYRITKPVNQIEIEINRIIDGNIDNSHKISLPQSLLNRIMGNKYYVTGIYVLIIIIPVIISFLLISSMSYKSIREQSVNCFENRIKQAGDRVDVNLRNYNSVAKYVFSEKNLNQRLAGYYDKNSNNSGQLNELLSRMVTSMPLLDSGELGLNIFDNDFNCIFFTNYKQRNFEKQLKEIDNNKANTTLYLSTVYDCGTYIMNFGKRLVALENWGDIRFFETIGYVMFSLNESTIERMYKNNIENIDKGVIYIADREGQVVSHPDKAMIRNVLDKEYIENIYSQKSANGVFTVNRGSEQYVISYNKLNVCDWVVIGEAPMKSIVKDIEGIRTLSVLLIIINVAIVIVLFLLFIKHVLKRIIKLNDAIAGVAQGDTNVRVQVKTGDEIQRLADGFNDMVSRLKWFMEDNYKKGIRIKEAELNALQAQINPHFLYNTLESINWKAMMLTKGQNTVSNMVTALATLLRLSINRGREVVTFEDEINHVKSYLVIQKERYSNKFDVIWDIDPMLYPYKTLKLILQPLVENAIYHGLELKPGKGTITIGGVIVDDYISISILDDGLGMSKEKLENVRSNLEEYKNSNEHRSIGLANVNERIKLYFGENYGLKIFSEVNAGTRIEISLPLYIGD